VDCLEQLKRSTYGRAKFDLPRHLLPQPEPLDAAINHLGGSRSLVPCTTTAPGWLSPPLLRTLDGANPNPICCQRGNVRLSFSSLLPH
jgi:hypothetical protein